MFNRLQISFNQKSFHINVPFYGAWSKYGWGQDDWGIGLNKKRIDFLAEWNETIYVSYGKKQRIYTIKATKVQEFPVEDIRDSNVKVYVVKKSALNYSKRIKEDIELEEMCKAGTFG